MKFTKARKFFGMYSEGFRSMTVGRSLWVIIILKLIIIFAVLKVFFLPNMLGSYDTDEQKAQAVRTNLIAP